MNRLRLIAREYAGVDVGRLFSVVSRFPRFALDMSRYSAQNKSGSFRLKLASLRPLLFDSEADAGSTTGHYFHQDLWAARLIFARRPKSHLDVGSRIDGFVSHLLAFMPVTVIDIRPLQSEIEGLFFLQQDATSLKEIPSNSVESLSSLHAVEHFGLGRYSDPIDPEAWSKTLCSFARVLQPNGFLYVSVPIGRERLEFNAQRVFSPSTIINTLKTLHLTSFAAVDDQGCFHAAADPASFQDSNYSCGMFEFTKPGFQEIKD